MKTLVTKLDIAGVEYEVHRCRLRTRRREDVKKNLELYGDCENPRALGPKQIRISSSLRGKELAETIIHEVLHAGDFDKSELWVSHVAERCADLLFTHPFDELLEEP